MSIDPNEDAFSLVVHGDFFNEEYSTNEDHSFIPAAELTSAESAQNKIGNENLQLKKNLHDRFEKKKMQKWIDTKRLDSSSESYQNGVPRNYNNSDLSHLKNDRQDSSIKRAKISPIKWISPSPKPCKYDNNDRQKRHHSRSYSPRRSRNPSAKYNKSYKDSTDNYNRENYKIENNRRKLRRSSSFELHQHLKYIFTNCQYFLIKSNNRQNVDLAKNKGVWATPPTNEQRINQAFDKSGNVILIFSIKESGQFQGFARVAMRSDRNHPPIDWVLPVGLSQRALSGVFKIDWISKESLPFSQTTKILNSYNLNQPIKVGRDGQEIDAKSGESLCRLFYLDEKVDIEAIARKAKMALKMHATFDAQLDAFASKREITKPSTDSYYTHNGYSTQQRKTSSPEHIYSRTPSRSQPYPQHTKYTNSNRYQPDYETSADYRYASVSSYTRTSPPRQQNQHYHKNKYEATERSLSRERMQEYYRGVEKAAFKDKYKDNRKAKRSHGRKREEERLGKELNEESNKYYKTLYKKRRSFSPESEPRKKLRSISPNKIDGHSHYVSRMQEIVQNNYSYSQQYNFDPLMPPPPPPPFPFFSPGYHFIPQHVLPYSTTTIYKSPVKKEKRNKPSKHTN